MLVAQFDQMLKINGILRAPVKSRKIQNGADRRFNGLQI